MKPHPCYRVAFCAAFLAVCASAQLIDRTKAPNAANEGIAKSLARFSHRPIAKSRRSWHN
jgi:hypothetical protein